MNWLKILGLLPFLISAALALICALSFKAWRKRIRRRSPLQGRKAGHLPGQQLLERVGHHHDELMTSVMLMYMALPIMFMAWAGIHLPWDRLHWGRAEYLFLISALALFGYGLYGYMRHLMERENARDGLIAERVTGMQLNRLAAQNCTVLHDLPADGFNIDHVVIAPRAVFAVETKSFRMPKTATDGKSNHVTYDGTALIFPDFVTRKPIDQATRQAQWLSRELRDALGMEFPVVAAVSLPGWHVDRTESGKKSGVWVFTPMGKGAEFMAWEPERINATERGLIAKALALRFPDIDE